MGVSTNSIPNATIEAIARSLFKETLRYGFKQVDYLRFVNVLLDMSMKNGNYASEKIEIKPAEKADLTNNLPLVGEQVKVREFIENKDRLLLEKWIAEKDGRHFLISRITARESDVNSLIKSEQNILGIITLNTTDEMPIGVLAFLDHDPVQRKAELRKLIGDPEFRGKGLAKEATKLWLQYGSSILGLKKIYLNTLDTNIRNIKLNEELGFKVEGILRNECCIDGNYHDVLKMAFLVE